MFCYIIIKAENLAGQGRTPKSWIPFAARLWGMEGNKITEFDFESQPPNRVFFRSAIPLKIFCRRQTPPPVPNLHFYYKIEVEFSATPYT